MPKVYHQSALQIREALFGKGGLDMTGERGDFGQGFAKIGGGW
jgi:hypothetical protein